MSKQTAEICSYAENPREFLDLLERSNCSFTDPTSFELESRYYQEYFNASYQGDISFIVHDNNVPAAVVRGQVVNGVIGDNGRGASVGILVPGVESILLRGLHDAAQKTKCHTIKLLETNVAGKLSLLGRRLMYSRAIPRVRVMAVADLAADEKILRSGLRTSHRPHVNWGLKSLKFECLTVSAFDMAKFKAFREFHIKVAGRETRNEESWNLQAKMVQVGRAELLLGYLDGHGLVAGALFLDTGELTTYGVGVYERDLFDKPLSHGLIFTGMLRAKERGQKNFLVGDVPDFEIANDKEFSIGWFKSGFTKDLAVYTEWTLPADALSLS